VLAPVLWGGDLSSEGLALSPPPGRCSGPPAGEIARQVLTLCFSLRYDTSPWQNKGLFRVLWWHPCPGSLCELPPGECHYASWQGRGLIPDLWWHPCPGSLCGLPPGECLCAAWQNRGSSLFSGGIYAQGAFASSPQVGDEIPAIWWQSMPGELLRAPPRRVCEHQSRHRVGAPGRLDFHSASVGRH